MDTGGGLVSYDIQLGGYNGDFSDQIQLILLTVHVQIIAIMIFLVSVDIPFGFRLIHALSCLPLVRVLTLPSGFCLSCG